MLDDDVKYAGFNLQNERNTKKIEIKDEGFWQEEFVKYFDLTQQMGYKIWGTRTESSPRGGLPYKPILTRSYVTASMMGIINDGEYYFEFAEVC